MPKNLTVNDWNQNLDALEKSILGEPTTVYQASQSSLGGGSDALIKVIAVKDIKKIIHSKIDGAKLPVKI